MPRSKLRFVKYIPALLCAAALFIVFSLYSDASVPAAVNGIEVCVKIILPSLFPFFVVSNLLSALGLPAILGRVTAPLTSKLLRCPGTASAAFVLGLSGGYPLGAATVCDLYRRKEVGKAEAERLLGFCNNSGPAFIIGAVGAGVFGSAGTGLLLYFIHILAAFAVGIITRGEKNNAAPVQRPRILFMSFSEAFPSAVKSAVRACAYICGFVVFFSAFSGILSRSGIIAPLSFKGASLTGLEPSWFRSFFTGLLELGNGIASMSGAKASAENLSLAAFTLGFGGLSVHCQTLALAAEVKLKCGRHFVCRILHSVISAALAVLLSGLV